MRHIVAQLLVVWIGTSVPFAFVLGRWITRAHAVAPVESARTVVAA